MSAAGPKAGGSIFQDLRTRIDGDVLCDDISRSLYSCGASIYSLHPQAVIRPRHRQDVSRVLRFADNHRLSVTARGAATGLAGRD